ncbi:hypothetical protein ABPG77_010364 [Micractinium sp. CCAP 211/92]
MGCVAQAGDAAGGAHETSGWRSPGSGWGPLLLAQLPATRGLRFVTYMLLLVGMASLGAASSSDSVVGAHADVTLPSHRGRSLLANYYFRVEKNVTVGTANKSFSAPTCIASDDAGNVYLTDQNNKRVQKLSSDGNPILDWGSDQTAPNAIGTGLGITVVGSYVFVADYAAGTIKKFDTTGVYITEWDPALTFVYALCHDADGYLYAADFRGGAIKKFDPNRSPPSDPLWTQSGLPFADPIGCAVVGSTLVVSYQTENAIQLLKTSDGTPLTSFNTTGALQTYAVAAAGDGTFFYASLSPSFSDNEVQQVSLDGTAIAASVGFAGTRFFPVGMTVQPQTGDPQRIYVTSNFASAVYILTRDL